MVVLKRLSDARRDGDEVWAVIRGSAINQDGRSTGLTTPNVRSQEALLRQALRRCAGRARADRIRRVPRHRDVSRGPDGGGRAAGGVRAAAGRRLAAVARGGQEQHRPLGGRRRNRRLLIKMVLALRHRRLPANLHLRHLNPRIGIDGTPLSLLRDEVELAEIGGSRIAGVSSFGLSGTNAHVVLEEAPARAEAAAAETFRPIVLSGRTAAALAAQAERLRARVEADPGLAVADVAWTQARRASFEHRAVVVAADRRALIDGLRDVEGGRSSGGKLAVLFPGQGSQLPEMGAELERTFPVYRAALAEVVARLGPAVGEMLRAPAGSAAAARLDRTAGAQTGLFALQVALYRLWESWGVQPAYLLGHSIGEVTAAHVSGVLTLDDACALVQERARLLESLPAGGAMVAVEASEAEVRGPRGLPWRR